MNAFVATLAAEAARLLPEPPAGHDAFGYLAWEELVVDTARRLSHLGADCAAEPVTLTPHTRRLDGAALLSLATLVADATDPEAGQRALWLAVTSEDRASQEPGLLRAERSSHGHGPTNRRANRRRRALLSVKN